MRQRSALFPWYGVDFFLFWHIPSPFHEAQFGLVRTARSVLMQPHILSLVCFHEVNLQPNDHSPEVNEREKERGLLLLFS